MEYDILFLHPPSSFRKAVEPYCGIFPDEVGTNDLFLHTPIGVWSLYHRLEDHGYKPGYLNIGRLLSKAIANGETFDLDKIIEEAPAKGYGIDLHWAVHTPGALDLAQAIKKMYPNRFVLLGGISSTYFHKEILENYPFIDAVALGEADEAIIPLAEALRKNSGNPNLKKIPGLAYRSKVDNTILTNPVQIPVKWENVSFQSVEDEVTFAVIGAKGCVQNCLTCGGSQFSYKNFYYRERPLALEPDQLIEEIEKYEKRGVNRVYLVGDIRIMGAQYVDSFLTGLSKKRFNILIQQEIIFTVEKEYIERWKKATPWCSFSFRPESADPAVLKRIGKDFSDITLREMIKACRSLEIPLLLSFNFATPGQDADSIRSTMDFIEEVVDFPYINYTFEPIFFIDPGSPIFENPEKWGYHFDVRTIKDLKINLEKPHWSQCIGYHTDWLSKDEFINMILYVAERSNRIRLTHKPEHAALYLLNTENLELNRELIEQLRLNKLASGGSEPFCKRGIASPGAKGPGNSFPKQEVNKDCFFCTHSGSINKRVPTPPKTPGKGEKSHSEKLPDLINKMFPSYLLKDNLLRKVEIPEGVRIPYSPFPYLSHLLMQTYNISPLRLLKRFKESFEPVDFFPEEISLEEFKKSERAPDSLRNEISNIIRDYEIKNDAHFIHSLVDFEWMNELASRLTRKLNINKTGNTFAKNPGIGDFSKLTLEIDETVAIKTFDFNFERIDWKGVSNSNPVSTGAMSYLYFLQKGTRKVVNPFIIKLLELCKESRSASEVIGHLKETEKMEVFAIAANIGALVSEGILKAQN